MEGSSSPRSSPPRGILPRRSQAASPPTVTTATATAPTSPKSSSPSSPRPSIDRMPSTNNVDAVHSTAPEDVRADAELHAALLEAGAMNGGTHGPAPAPSLPSIPLPALDTPESDQQQQQQQQDIAAQMEGVSGTDSMTLGQIKGIVRQMAKPKQQRYSYRQDDSDTTKNELEEFFSYVEVPGVVTEGRECWERGWKSKDGADWPDAPQAEKLTYLRQLLEQLDHRDNDRRFEAARRIAYVSQGTPMYSSSDPDYLLLLVIANCRLLREVGALQMVFEAVKNAGGRWASISGMPDTDMQGWPTPQERQEYLEEINSELAVLFSILYFMTEIFRGDDTWADDMMSLDPPLPFYLWGIVANLRDKNAKGYPVKKLLLLLWKSILATLGGAKDMSRVKKLVREVEGLPADVPPPPTRMDTKVAPSDLLSFRSDITSKYPSYAPPPMQAPVPSLSYDRIASAAAPSPLRPLYPYTQPSTFPPPDAAPIPPHQQQPPHPATPAPSPPPSPKPKKQQYQTDQSRPFVLPFSRATRGANVPRSINEAGALYAKHVRLSTELWQTTKVREECIADESGVAFAREMMEEGSLDDRTSSSGKRRGRSGTMASSVASDEDADEDREKLPDSLEMLQRYEEEVRREAKAAEDTARRKELEQRAMDVRRLQRIELLYRHTLPQLQSAVIVLLKLLLATVTANNNLGNLPSVTDEELVMPSLSLEDTDIMRHREITSKAVSAILILTLKWFKVSHVMKFQYFSQLIVDSNGLLLILKMFGSQEVSTLVKMRNEVEDANFFRYCFLHGTDNPPELPRPEDALLNGSSTLKTAEEILDSIDEDGPAAIPAINNSIADDSEGVELINEYSWRNFFAAINFVHILQKLTKRKVHRILLLTQYKAQAILKRILKISQPLLQLYLLKLIKSQVPYSGRKWRQSNMKVITAIYLNCRPDLRDEWLTGMDVDVDIEESLPHEQALRGLIKFYNTKHYGAFAPHLHRQHSATFHQSNTIGDPPHLPPQPSPSLAAQEDSFPPARSAIHYTHDSYFRSGYGADTDGYLEDYEAILGDLLTPRYTVDSNGVPSLYPEDGGGAQAESAWQRLGELLGDVGDVSDSESVGSIGFLGFGDGEGSEAGSEDEARPDWSEMSPETIDALEEERALQELGQPLGSPRAPRPRRASSGPKSPALRPVFVDFNGTGDNEEAIEDDEERGPAPSEEHSGPPVDEVEAVFGS